jgi:hypothetical protein
MRLKLFLAIFLITGIFIIDGWTDTLLLTSGEQLIGKIIREDDQQVVVDVNGVQLSVRRFDITEIVRSGDTTVTPTWNPPDYSIDSATSGITTPSQDSVYIPPSNNQFQTASPSLDSATPQPLLPIILPQNRVYQVAGTGVSFREGPSLEHRKIDSLSSQTVLLEIEMSDGWLHAQTLEGIKGWIFPNFVTPLASVPCLVNGDGLQIRTDPGEFYRRVARLRRGEVVLKLDERGDWWFVLYQGSIAGWCHKDYLVQLTDTSFLDVPYSLVNNQTAGMPILVQMRTDQPGTQLVSFTVRDPHIVISGKTKLLVLHRDKTKFTDPEFNYVSQSILSKDRLNDSIAILNSGLPEQVAGLFIGADILTLLGQRVADGWQFDLIVPEVNPPLSYGFVVQWGESRGKLVMIQ